MGLPLELLLLIAEFAAWDSVWNDKLGRTANLTLVSRAFKAVVDPVLYHCIHVSDSNFQRLRPALSSDSPGFALTRKLLVTMCRPALNLFLGCEIGKILPYAEYLAGPPETLQMVLFLQPAPRIRALLMTHGIPSVMQVWFTRDDVGVSVFARLTHLFISFHTDIWARRGRTEPLVFRRMPVLTHLAPDVAGGSEAPDTIYDIFAPWLPRTLERLVFRRGAKDAPAFSLAVEELACKRRDRRLWLADGAVGPGQPGVQYDLNNMRIGLALWDQGVQLYNPPSPDP